MLSFLRTNQNLISVITIPFLILLYLPAFMGTSNWEGNTPGIISNWLFQLLDPKGFFIKAIAIIVIFFNGFLINELVLKHELGKEQNLFPGLFYMIISCLFLEFLGPSPIHFANYFLILSLIELFKTYRINNCDAQIFNAGFWLAVASGFYFPFVVFLVLGIVGLNLMRALKLNEILVFLSGFFAPYFLLFTYLFWFDKQHYLFQSHLQGTLSSNKFIWPTELLDIFKLSWMSLLILLTLLSSTFYLSKTKMQPQKKIQLLFWCLFLSFFSCFIPGRLRIEHFLIASVPLGIFISFTFTSLNRQLGDVVFFLVLIGILFLQYKDLLFNYL